MAEAHKWDGTNRLLSALPRDSHQEIAPGLERVSLRLREMVYEPRKPIEFVYFPLTAVISVLADMEEENLVEVATVGNEGMAGLPIFLGAREAPGVCFSQIPGESLRMKADFFRRVTRDGGPLARLLHRYTQALMTQISQGTACNRVHSLSQRCARWLLMTHDRVNADEFQLTQEFLGQMLGVRRATVNEVATRFQGMSLISYTRGRIRIVNRKGLESESCRCYWVIREEYERMLADQDTEQRYGGLTLTPKRRK
jgi:CRP-like cAMP-binding protein